MMLPDFAWFLLFLANFLVINGDKTCEEKMEDVKLVPTYFDKGTPGDLQVTYNGKDEVICGGKMEVFKTQTAPVVKYDVEGKCEEMSIIFFDPDTTRIPGLKLFLHWFVLNIPSDVMAAGYDGKSGNVSATYFPPLTITGDHRYTFCVYCQKETIKEVPCMSKLYKRIGVNPRSLAEKYSLGNPEACNFMYSVFIDLGLKNPVLDKVFDAKKDLGNNDETVL